MALRSLVGPILMLSMIPAVVVGEASPSGRWTVISDTTQRPVAIMKVFEHNGEYQGMIERVLDKGTDAPSPLCDKCPGQLKGHPIEGLVVMQGLKRAGSQYAGGRILDPDSGHYYRVRMNIGPEGKTLMVRGYFGVDLLGRTQTWHRVE